MAFIAQWAGVCDACDEWFKPGTEIEYTTADRLVHVRCPAELIEIGPAETVCMRCFCVHAGDCA